MVKTYRCDFYREGLAIGGGHEVQATDAERAAEAWLTEHDEQSLAADLISTDFGVPHSSTVFVLDDQDEIWKVEVDLTASIAYRADAKSVQKMLREEE